MRKQFIFLLLLQCVLTRVQAQCEESFRVIWSLTSGNSINALDAVFTPQNNLVVAGSSLGKGIVIHFNADSSIRWAKTFSTSYVADVTIRHIEKKANGGFYLAAYSTDADRKPIHLMISLDNTGNILWVKRMYDLSSVAGLTYEFATIMAIAETPDQGLAVAIRKSYLRPDGGTNYRNAVYKLSATGTIVWTREDTQGNDDEPSGMLIDQDKIVIVGTSYSVQQGIRYGFLEKLNHSTGNVDQLLLYNGGGTSNWFRSIEKIPGGYEIGTQIFSGGKRTYFRLRINEAGQQLSCITFPEMGPNLIDQYYYPVPLPDGSSILWRAQYYSATELQLTKINSNHTVGWNYQYTQPGTQSVCKVLPTGNSSALIIGGSPWPSTPNSGSYLQLVKVTANGITESCQNDPLPFSTKDSVNYNFRQGTWQTTALNFAAPFDLTLIAADVTLSKTKVCETVQCVVNNVSLTGDTVICKPNSTAQYKIRINGNCIPQGLQWSLSSPVGNLQTINDSTVQIQYTTAGSALLQANFQTACSSYSATIRIEYRPATATLELGNPVSFCPGDSTVLSAGNQFNSVLWNNGSTANNITVNTAGVYSVIVSQDAVCFQKDTITITTFSKPVVTLPDNNVLCSPENIVLNAGSNFNSYVWHDGSTQQTFTVEDTGKYWVTVTDMNQCTAADTVTILQKIPKPENFAAIKDTAICFGEKLILSVTNNYAFFNWQNNSSTQSTYEVSKPGIYNITVQTAEGCVGTDSVIVQDKGCVQTIFVPNAFTPNNDGINDLFNAVVFGTIELFEFSVYNRYGELVFQTTEATKGWNGFYKAQLQPSSTFTWKIRYRFAGAATDSMLKGTVVLIQ
jgi:gliding motility-associated-like protein